MMRRRCGGGRVRYMGVRGSGSRIGTLAVAALLAVAVVGAALATDAGAAKLVGANGRVYACYKAKGKSKGAVRLVAKKGRCKRGEQKISWNVTGPAGKTGQSGENGSSGETGSSGATGEAGLKTLEQKVTQLTSKVTSLESVLSGITNSDLTGMLAKLQGISGAQLQEAVASVADVKALCSQASVLTDQANALGTALGGLELGGLIPVGLELLAPGVPAALEPFGC
jgi:hypothetical protein